MQTNSSDIQEYIQKAPKEVQNIIEELRKIVLKTVPDAVESYSYGLVGYKFKGKPLAYFGYFKNHIGYYPIPSTVEEFKSDLAKFKTSKGGVQFQFTEPIPYELVERMLKYRKQSIINN